MLGTPGWRMGEAIGVLVERDGRQVAGHRRVGLEQIEAACRNQRERIEQLEVFINRFRYQATKAKQVQSRIKELEKIERIELPEEEKTIHFSFPQPKPGGRIVAEFGAVAKSYGKKEVFRDVSFMIERGDRIALVGVNGAGKSTLIKLLSQTEPLTEGEYKLGHNVQADYFAQDQYKELNPDARILDDLGDLGLQLGLIESNPGTRGPNLRVCERREHRQPHRSARPRGEGAPGGRTAGSSR